MSGTGRRLAVAVVFPDLLGTYGDGGNGVILARRAAWRGIDVDLVQALSDRPLPTADLYTLGGGEDGPQVRAATTLAGGGDPGRPGGRGRRGARGVRRLPGHRQLLPDSAGRPHPGVGLLDLTTAKGTGARAVGELVAAPTAAAPRTAAGRPPAPTSPGSRTTAACRPSGRAPVRWPGSSAASATAGATAPRAPGRAGSSAPTCTGRCWPATRPWPTCCSVGRWPRPMRRTARRSRSSPSTTTRSWPCGPSGSRPSTGPEAGWRGLARRLRVDR